MSESKKGNVAKMLGKIVTVTVDRPLGSYHPEHPDLYYPINYGYIENTLAADGEEIDAYILGVDHPVEKFTGRVIAVIHRFDDVEDKLVVAPLGLLFDAAEISRMTEFQERYFKSEIESFSCGEAFANGDATKQN